MDTYPYLDVNICKQCTSLFSGNMQESVQVVNFYFKMCTGMRSVKYAMSASCILLTSQTWKLPWKLSSFHKWFPTCALGVYTCTPLEHVMHNVVFKLCTTCTLSCCEGWFSTLLGRSCSDQLSLCQ